MKNLTWKYVFNCQNVFPQPFYKCLEVAKGAGYDYMAFNGRVYDVRLGTLNEHVCLESDLDKPKQMEVTTHTTITPSPSDVEFINRVEKIMKELQDSLDTRTKGRY